MDATNLHRLLQGFSSEEIEQAIVNRVKDFAQILKSYGDERPSEAIYLELLHEGTKLAAVNVISQLVSIQHFKVLEQQQKKREQERKDMANQHKRSQEAIEEQQLHEAAKNAARIRQQEVQK